MKTKDPKQEYKRHKSDAKIRPYWYGKFLDKLSIQYWKEYIKKVRNKESLYLVQMKLSNGKSTMFTVTSDDNTFSFKKGTYHIDPDMTVHDIHSGLDMLFYHQECASPFSIQFNLDNLKKSLKKSNVDDESNIIKAINPQSLKDFINSKVIEKVLKGQEMTDVLDKMMKLIIIGLVLSAGVLFLVAKGMGFI